MAQPRRILISEAIARLERHGIDVTEQTLRGWCRRGSVDAVRVGGRWFLSTADIDQLVTARTV